MEEIKSDQGYSKEFKSQVLKDCFETGNYSSVAKKYGIPPTTIYDWIRREKNKEKIQAKKSKKAYEKEISDLKLENEILKELLKKRINSGSKNRSS